MKVYVLTHWSDESGVYEYNGVFLTLDNAMKYIGDSYQDGPIVWKHDGLNLWKWDHSFGEWVIKAATPR